MSDNAGFLGWESELSTPFLELVMTGQVKPLIDMICEIWEILEVDDFVVVDNSDRLAMYGLYVTYQILITEVHYISQIFILYKMTSLCKKRSYNKAAIARNDVKLDAEFL